ncbi:hypothetical protein HJC23_012435 [Cyclotella cryptica]|uniref:PhoD-like phosphatase metallophosphatase domain-containing protein n=1 Tax=Cyclotella cryptica TaxID=29204 RepID=A0ABD3Q851_9STRA
MPSQRTNTDRNSDVAYPSVHLSRLAFGSCHSRGAVDKRLSKSRSNNNGGLVANSTIWDVITATVEPQAFLWTGDAIYPPMKLKGDTPLDVMQDEYKQMMTNETLGYANFRRNQHLIGGLHGVWDDHDYGGNDRGRELTDKKRRRDVYLDFLGVSRSDTTRRQRRGLYSSVEFGSDIESNYSTHYAHSDERHNNKVKVIFLDTRWHREKHCIPSVGSNPYIPFGAIVACITRWITAGLDLPSYLPSWICSSRKLNAILGEEQWMWLEQELKGSSASVHIIVSSIQVLTTNPVVESWGHFPHEREKLLKLLNTVSGVIILSGDVHHAEISTTSSHHLTRSRIHSNKGAIVEVTSSGLTHSCDGPKIYGPLCRPILNLFPSHRFEGGNVKDVSLPSYYTGVNFGSIDFDWPSRSFEVNVHDEHGDVFLSTGSLGMDSSAGLTTKELEVVAKCIDGHFLGIVTRMKYPTVVIFLLFCCYFWKPVSSRLNWKSRHDKKD